MAAQPTIVLDASAFLAMIKGEKGWDRVAAVLSTSTMSVVNAAEVYSKMVDWGMTRDEQFKFHALLENIVQPFDLDLAVRSGALRGPTRARGLSLADRACLAYAQSLGVPAMTADKAWAGTKIDVAIELVR